MFAPLYFLTLWATQDHHSHGPHRHRRLNDPGCVLLFQQANPVPAASLVRDEKTVLLISETV
jgi:hypothetical protein